jgi:Methyltransferase domain
MREAHLQLIEKITALGGRWHDAGTVSRHVLLAIANHCEARGGLRHSAETGAGRSTLLFSHLSDNHLVFAKDEGRSLSQTRTSPLLRGEHVTFVEGPTQQTLPNYRFDRPFQLVFIDGPHGYPFPDLEYYFFYPHLETDGLLILDDTNTPSIGRMFDILRADPMYELLEVVDHTAFLRRTSAPMIDPCSDSWWLQGYNSSFYEQVRLAQVAPIPSRFGPFLRRLAALTPQAVKNSLPDQFKKKLWKRM